MVLHIAPMKMYSLRLLGLCLVLVPKSSWKSVLWADNIFKTKKKHSHSWIIIRLRTCDLEPYRLGFVNLVVVDQMNPVINSVADIQLCRFILQRPITIVRLEESTFRLAALSWTEISVVLEMDFHPNDSRLVYKVFLKKCYFIKYYKKKKINKEFPRVTQALTCKTHKSLIIKEAKQHTLHTKPVFQVGGQW